MSCKKSGPCRIRRITHCLPSVGDVVRWGLVLGRVVGLSGDTVYLVALDCSGLPVGLVLRAPVFDLFFYHVGAVISFRLNGEVVRGRVKSYDSLGRCIVRLDDSYLPGNPIRVFHLSSSDLLEVV